MSAERIPASSHRAGLQVLTGGVADVQACRWGACASICTLVGIVLPGPLALVLLSAVHPQPPWTNAEIVARHYHPGAARAADFASRTQELHAR